MYPPVHVMPRPLGLAVDDLPYWFVIGGQAVRCFAPYRPSRDVDFGVKRAADLEDLLEQLGSRGEVVVLERSENTVHLTFDRIKVSLFLLPDLARFTEERALSTTGVLATKLHAILDRGTRRDFFDLYVTLQHHQLGITQCLAALREVYTQQIDDTLLLRALTYFVDAEQEAPLPGEGPSDWKTVKDFFITRVGNLLVPPTTLLQIQSHTVDIW